MVEGRGPQGQLGGYQLEEELGCGSTGTVWRAHRAGPVRQVVALKRLRAGAGGSDVDRLRREAEILAQLDHPHIVRVLEVLDDGGTAVVMQYAPGGSLQDLLAECGRLAPGQVVAVAAPLADALASAHRRDVLHCDVKPGNVLFTSDGEPLLSDFGVARRFASAVTADQVVAGTAEYLAPELLDGGRPEARSDVYSLGVVCYEALAGRPPYTGDSPLAVVRAADKGHHVPVGAVAGVPPALAEVVERAIARNPADRHRGAAELARALRSAVAPGDVALPAVAATVPGIAAAPGTRTFGPRPPRPAPPPPAERRPRRVLILGASLAALVAAILVAGPVRRSLGGGGDPPVPTTASPCPSLVPPPVPAGAALLEGDLDGDGCPSFAVRQGDQLEAVIDPGEVRPRRYQLGQAGDHVLLGDWDCDGVDTPGLYRPATGEVFYFFEWGRQGAPLPQAEAIDAGRRGATPSVSDNGASGCQEIVLRGGEVDGER